MKGTTQVREEEDVEHSKRCTMSPMIEWLDKIQQSAVASAVR